MSDVIASITKGLIDGLASIYNSQYQERSQRIESDLARYEEEKNLDRGPSYFQIGQSYQIVLTKIEATRKLEEAVRSARSKGETYHEIEHELFSSYIDLLIAIINHMELRNTLQQALLSHMVAVLHKK